MDMRIRLAELMKDSGIDTAYALSKRTEGRISMSTAHRLVKSEGRARYFDAEVLDVLCDVFGVEPGELLERERAVA